MDISNGSLQRLQDGQHAWGLRAAPAGFDSVVALGRNSPHPLQTPRIRGTYFGELEAGEQTALHSLFLL